MGRDCTEIATHLRTVHFSLILACTLAAISLSGQSASKLDAVNDQLAQVLKIKTHWMTWTKRFGTEQISWLQNQGLASPQKIPGEIYIPADELSRYNLPQRESGWTARPLYSPIYLHLSVSLPTGSRHEILGRGWPRANETELVPGGYDATGNPKFDSLEDFRLF